MTNVVIIGAGVGGLATAVRLAAAGHRVTVFEQADQVGGKLGRLVVPLSPPSATDRLLSPPSATDRLLSPPSATDRLPPAGEFRFDTGPSLVTLPQVFADVVPDLDLVELDPIVRHRFPDGSVLDSCRDPDEFAGRIEALAGPGAADDWRRLWRRAARVWDASWRHILTRPLTSPLAVGRLAWRLRDLAAVAPGRTLRGLGRSTLRDHRLRMLLDRYATYAGADPRRAPAALVAIPYAELHFGGWYVPGGLARIADALLAAAESRGVAVRLGTAVSRIETAAGRACGVTLADGTRVPADVVVANADAAHVYRDLLPTPGRLAAMGDRSLAGFVVLLGLRGTGSQAHHTVYFPHDYDAEFDAVFGGRMAADPTVFVTAAADDVVRPPGHEAWFVLVNAAPQGAVDWTVPGRADAYADRVLDRLADRGADVRDRVLFRAVRTPADLRDQAWAPGGTIYGTAAHGLTGLLRPPNRGPVRGLFLVGGSVHPGGGLPMVLLSSAIVAAQIR